jgi:DNA modification methylase
MIYQGDSLEVLKSLPDKSVDCCVTSPPYWGLRDYGHDGQIGLEKTPEEFVSKLVTLFREVRRVLKDEGTLWLNLGDSYTGGGRGGHSAAITGEGKNESMAGAGLHSGLKPKDLVGIPWRVAFALQSDGWYLRQDIVWHKPNPMPESVTDRCTKAHEYIFLLSKSAQYYFDSEAIQEPAISAGQTRGGGKKYSSDESSSALGGTHNLDRYGVTPDFRNKRSVWAVSTKPFSDAHFATYPIDLITPCILAGCPAEGIVLDPFFGSG